VILAITLVIGLVISDFGISLVNEAKSICQAVKKNWPEPNIKLPIKLSLHKSPKHTLPYLIEQLEKLFFKLFLFFSIFISIFNFFKAVLQNCSQGR